MCLAVVLGLLSSCSGTDYLNAIPKKSTALISVDMQQMASGKSDEDKAGMLKSLLRMHRSVASTSLRRYSSLRVLMATSDFVPR